MRYLIGGIFLLISIWQFIVTGLWSRLVFAIISFAVAIASFFYVSF